MDRKIHCLSPQWSYHSVGEWSAEQVEFRLPSYDKSLGVLSFNAGWYVPYPSALPPPQNLHILWSRESHSCHLQYVAITPDPATSIYCFPQVSGCCDNNAMLAAVSAALGSFVVATADISLLESIQVSMSPVNPEHVFIFLLPCPLIV